MPREPCIQCGAPGQAGEPCSVCGHAESAAPVGPLRAPARPCLRCGAPTPEHKACGVCGRKPTQPGANWGRGRGPAWRKLRSAVLKRDPICRICGVRRSTRADHWPIARADGGPDTLDNLRGICEPCDRPRVAAQAADGRRRQAARAREQRRGR
jgi:hypothetical protein